MQFPNRVYGPGPLRSPGSRVLLATPGVDYTDAEAEAILAASQGLDVPTNPDRHAVDPVVPVVEESGLIRRGNGWWELPDGTRVRGKAHAEEALAVLRAASGVPVTGDHGLSGLDSVGSASGDQPPVLDAGVPPATPADELERPPVHELRPLGGDWYELPTGDRIRGLEEAEAALAVLVDGHDTVAAGGVDAVAGAPAVEPVPGVPAVEEAKGSEES